MTPHFSAYLDLVRIACAVLVVLSHLAHSPLVSAYLWPFSYVGNEAVMAFFVLSGFIIAYVRHTREKTVQDYAMARLARLYSVILPAMLLTLVLDVVGTAVNAAHYAGARAFSDGNPQVAYGLSALMLNASWGIDQHFGSNGAYWSIPYEFWYYVLFGAWAFFSGLPRLALTLLAALVAGPRILLLMPVWLLGVALYHARTLRRPAWLDAMAAIGGLALLLWMLRADASSLGKAGVLGLEPDGLAWQYLVGCCIAAHLFGAPRFTHLLDRLFQWIRHPMQWAADSTLALYLFHLPVLHALHAVLARGEHSAAAMALVVLAPFAVALTLGHWCEMHKRPLRAGLARALQRLRPAAEPRP
ncbi:acyltransferase [Pseudorhodoferax sp. Leaf267]|uniref:acyltransferase family protein n=1 Tax=Pseudorhodoferax sp. Leaf267 TaxID=1736316 RepID=UPI0006F841EA|nr:acyltransferase [Pseudorhodoferax sp. Leaf267]KQP13293.1 hypothetical protein ASF43_19565 [Pseudorhodoferax sp. Leaf267]